MSWYRALALASLLLLAACAQNPPVPPLNLSADITPVSARYMTDRHHAHDDHALNSTHQDIADFRNEWLFWRSADQVEVSIPQQQTGERWLKDASTIFYQKLFHEDQKIVEYQREDLMTLDVTTDWQTNLLMIDPVVLQQLTVKGKHWIDGHPTLVLRGKVNDIDYDLVWLVDLNIPYRLDKRDPAGNRERTQLLEVHAGIASPLQAPDTKSYEIIDYTDLGDRERDPFVIKIQHHLLGGPMHSH